MDFLVGWMNTSQFGQVLQQSNLMLLGPEIVLLITILGCFFQCMGKTPKDRNETLWVAVFGLVLVVAFLLVHLNFLYMPNAAIGQTAWLNEVVGYGMFQADLFSWLARFLLAVGTLLLLLISRDYIESRSPIAAEFYILILSALLGGMLLVGASDLIMLFVALELLGISSYILVGLLRDDIRSAEASLRYLLYGGASSAVLLFGFSMLYGIVGSTSFAVIIPSLQQLHGAVPPFMLPVMMTTIIAGVAFKLSAAPFHMWAPDVYEGAPTPITAFLSVISKLAAFAVAARIFVSVLGAVEGITLLLVIISVLSMVVGNVAALVQRNIKRLLAYSTVAHAGYMLLGFLTLESHGVATMMFYMMAYLFMNLGAFACVIWFNKMTGRDDVASYAGLVHKRPALATAFSIFLLSLAGIPIFSGFFAKFFLFQSVATLGGGYIALVIVALLTSTISLYYYLNVIRLMVVAEPSEAVEALDAEPAQAFGQLSPLGITVTVCLLLTIALGLFAEPVMGFVDESTAQMASNHTAVNVAQLPR